MGKFNQSVSYIRIFVISAWALMSILYLFEITVIDTYSLSGLSFAEIEQAKQYLTLQNSTLRAKIAKASSLQTVAQKAQNLNFVPINSVIYLP